MANSHARKAQHESRRQLGGTALISGVQALTCALLEQRTRDQVVGLNTRGYVSGYRGSPLGGFDLELTSRREELLSAGIVFEPGLNEDLAATAIAGTQQLSAFGSTDVDGVFGLWYGKGPGVDRSGDALKHGHLAGSSRHGGVVLAFGDDHPGKSSTTAHQSEHALAAHCIPILYPACVEEIVRYTLLGWAMSRFAGVWVALKLVNETAETTATVNLSAATADIYAGPASTLAPDIALPAGGLHFRGGFAPQRDEALLMHYKLPHVSAFAHHNVIDRIVVDAPSPALCIVTAGKAYVDVRQALNLLGITDARAALLGLRLYKIGMIWPLDARSLLNATQGCAEIFVIEEKRPILEDQIARACINSSSAPRLVGKLDETAAALVPSVGQLEPASLALSIAKRLGRVGRSDSALEQRVRTIESTRAQKRLASPDSPVRLPYFCSGCPHNISTRVPEGSTALGGIGCHTMAIWMNRRTLAPVQMGAEGANWIGASHFLAVTDGPADRRRHVFQNLGDGTYSHSGLLAIRAAVNAGVNITYKILHNEVVAMTGGQLLEGALGVSDIAMQVLAAGVKRCVVLSDDPVSLRRSRLPGGVGVLPRTELDRVQTDLRAIRGTTVLIFSQMCAAEKRRLRKRGELPDPPRRMFINEAVCENCGDCTAQSNCVSILPLQTRYGRKRAIDQSSCNKDFSCVDGFCPSFVTVSGGTPRRSVPAYECDEREASGSERGLQTVLPAPPGAVDPNSPYAILITGIGGTGVVTIGTMLVTAAHLEGKRASTFNMTGLAQKGGAVYSHLRIAPANDGEGTHSSVPLASRIGSGEADLVLGCDLVVSASQETLSTIDADTTYVALNRHVTPTAAFQLDTDFELRGAAVEKTIRTALSPVAQLYAIDATEIAIAVFGDAVFANMLMVGVAYQLGRLPLSARSIESAIREGGVAPERNLAAFNYGRRVVHQPALLEREPESVPDGGRAELESLVADRRALLCAYQNERYAARYEAFVRQVETIETRQMPGQFAFSIAVARYLAKLMAYKDEYEVGRLYAGEAFRQSLHAQFEGRIKLQFHLAPPFLASLGRPAGTSRKLTLGSWAMGMFYVLARLKVLRGTPLDIFGYARERRLERRLIEEYRNLISTALRDLSPAHHPLLVELACYPEHIRGFGHVKEAHLRKALARRDAILERLALLPGPLAPL